jgi:predicted metalloprotease
MPKPSPTPWSIEATSFQSWGSWTIKASDGRSVAACSNNVKRPEEEKKANGFLMVNAPEMYAELIMARGHLSALAECEEDNMAEAKSMAKRTMQRIDNLFLKIGGQG